MGAVKATAEKSSTPSVSRAEAQHQPLVSRAGGGDFFPRVQAKMTVSAPGDKFEHQAEKTADNVMRMSAPQPAAEGMQRKADNKVQRRREEQILLAPSNTPRIQPRREEQILRAPEKAIQKTEMLPERREEQILRAPADDVRKKELPPRSEEHIMRAAAGGGQEVSSPVQSAIQSKTTGGEPLGSDVRAFMEPRFGADFGGVRVHRDADAASLNNQLSARAFTHQNHIFFSRDQYQPGTSEGKHLLAHELTHTIQQGHSVQTSPEITATSATPAVQRLGIQDALDKFADWAYNIPGFRMLTFVLGFNPVNMRSTDRNAANLLRALIELLPGGAFITQALDNHGVINKAAAWVEAKLAELGDIGGQIVDGLKRFLDSLSWTDIFDLGGVWDRAKRIFTEPISRLIDFGISVAVEILKMVKDAILKPLAALAQGTRGYDLLCAILGQDPISGEPVPRTAETLLGGFMKLIGQEEIWENIKKGNAIARAWAWFQTALDGLMGFVRSVPGRIVDTLTSLTFRDVITVAGAFTKIVTTFANIAVDFVTWGLSTIWELLKIIFDVVKPGLMGYIQKTGAALKGILKNPMPFLGNLVRAAKLGFTNFATNFGGHLKAGLIDWLTGSLEGVYIPKAFSLVEFGKMALSVLGITWAQIRGKIVKALGENGEKIMHGLEVAFDVIVKLVQGGVGALWEMIKEKLTDLKDQLVAGIISFVTDSIIKKAIPKLISLFIPGAGFIQAIISIYDTIMVFVHKLAKIAQVVGAFIDSIVAIAAGNISGAANRVESVLANLLSLAISFLAGFLGLGKVTDKVMEVVQKIREKVDQAIEAAITWIVAKAKALFASLFGKKDKPDDRTPEQKQADLAKAMSAASALQSAPDATEESIHQGLGKIKADYRMTSLDLVVDSDDESEETVHIDGTINPGDKSKPSKVPKGEGLKHLKLTRPKWIENADFNVYIKVKEKHEATPASEGPVKGAPKNVFDKSGKFKVGGKWARRHILSSKDMKTHYEQALILPNKTYKTASEALKARNSDAQPNKSSITTSAQALLARFHNDVNNLWVGETKENSSLQENVDASPEMYDKEGDLRVEKLQDHIQKMADTYAIPGGVGLTVSDKHDVLVKNEYVAAGS